MHLPLLGDHWSFYRLRDFPALGVPMPNLPFPLLGATRVSLPNGISFRPTVLAGCVSVTDVQTDGSRVDTSVAIGGIADATPPNNNKKAVLSQGNRAMPQLFFLV